MKPLIRKYVLVNASMAAMFGLALPVMYLALLDKGLSLVQMGKVMAAFCVSAMLFEVPFGSLADAIGRKRVFLLGEGVLLLATAGFWLSSSVSALVVVMILTGMSRALFSGSLDALMVKQFQEKAGSEEFGSAFLAAQAKVGGISAICLGLAAILGGFLPMWFSMPVKGHPLIGYYEINYVLMLPLIVLHFILTLSLIDDPRDNEHRSKQGVLAYSQDTAALIRDSVALISRSPLMLGLMIIEVIGGCGLATVDAFWQPRFAQFVNARSDGWLFGILCSISFLAAGFGHRSAVWLDKIFDKQYLRVLLMLQLLIGLSIMFLALQVHIAGFFIGYAAIYLVKGAMDIPMLVVFHGQAADRMRSTLLSMKSFFEQLGNMISFLLFAHIAQAFGIGVAWTVAGMLIFIGSVVFLLPAVRRCASGTTASRDPIDVAVSPSG